MPDLDGDISNMENCQKSGNMKDSPEKAKDLLDSLTSIDKPNSNVLKPKKTGNSIRKQKSKAQAL